MDSFDPVTRQGLAVSNLFGLELIVSGLLLALVVVWLGLALRRYRARTGDGGGEPAQIEGNTRLELVWTITPAVVLAVVFVLVVQTMGFVDAPQPGAVPLRVIGHQWWWEFQYPDSQALTANELHLPVGTPLQLSLESVDVIHSFQVPNFGMMRDAVPGRTNTMSILVDRQGVYSGSCNQYCGVQHAWMRISVVAEPTTDFEAWLQRQRTSATPSGSPGEQVFVRNTCVNCHVIRGVGGTTSVGPDLTHVGGRQTLGAGVIPNTPNTMRSWIRDAQSIKPGVLMPAFASLGETDLSNLVDYLESLK
jgi:cytochrome c oxidase subunit 2